MPKETPGDAALPEPQDQPSAGAPIGFEAADGYGLTTSPPTTPSEIGDFTAVGAAAGGPSLTGSLGAEVFGTFIVILAGLGTALYSSYSGAQLLGVALAFGAGVAIAYLVVSRVSGGHFNPAITLGAALAGRTRWGLVLPYWVAQLIGAALASSLLFLAMSTFPALDEARRSFFSATANGFGGHSPLAVAASTADGFSLVAALLIEAVITAVLVAVFLAVTDSRRERSVGREALGIGGTLAVLILVATPVTNAGLNPVRSTAAALFAESWAWDQLWVFWVAPLAGAAVAALLYQGFLGGSDNDDLDGDFDPELESDAEIEEGITVVEH